MDPENGEHSGQDFSQQERQVERVPSVDDLIDACRGILSGEDIFDLVENANDTETEDMGMSMACGFAFEKLLEAGIENPEQYLIDRGILQ
jgi:hypothetical protein